MTLQPNHNFILESTQEHSFLTFFKDLPQKSNTTIRIFDRGEYYTVHGPDALFTAKEIFKTLAVIKYMNKDHNKLEYVVLSKMNFEKYARDLLLVKRYCLELYKGSNIKNDWSLSHKASPGNMWQMEDILFTNMEITSLSSLISIKIKNDECQQNIVGIAYYEDVGNMLFKIIEFCDNDQFSNFESCVVHLNPKECLVPGDKDKDSSSIMIKIREILERNKVLITDRRKSDYDTQDVVQDLNKLVKFRKSQATNFAALPEMQLKTALGALASIIKYLELLSNEAHFNLYTVEKCDLSLYMKLDLAAIRALNLLPESNMTSDVNNRSSQELYSILNKCRTPQGQRLLQQWIKQPLMDKNKIDQRLNIVELLVENPDIRKMFSDSHLRRMPDFQRIARKFLRKRGTLQDVYKIYQAIKWIPNMASSLRAYRGSHVASLNDPFCLPLMELKEDFAKYEEMVETMLDLKQIEESMEYMIKPEFDEELQSLRNTLDDLETKINTCLISAAHNLKLEANKSIKLDFNPPIGYHYRITKKEEKCLRGNGKFVTIDTNKNGIRFQDKKLQGLNSVYMENKAAYQEHQKVVVAEIMNIASGYIDPLLKMTELTASLDVLVSFAEAAQMAPIAYVRPKLFDKGEQRLDIKQARNPCMELQDGLSFIPNDITFDRGTTSFYVITGPNMGGKSTYIRTVGIIVLMAQIGSFVPCSAADISVKDAILARVGAGDCQQRGVSTFMAEMLETTAILKHASEYSLIIIDELGRGTSTYDGFGLAWAISEHIALNLRAYTLFATHFHELTELSLEIPRVKNLHVTALAADSTLTLLYKVKPGACDRSFGIYIAKMSNFPQRVVEMAKEKADLLGDLQYDSLIGESCPDLGPKMEPSPVDIVAKQEGLSSMKHFLKSIRDVLCNEELGCDGNKEAVRERFSALVQSMYADNNPYLKMILSKGR